MNATPKQLAYITHLAGSEARWVLAERLGRSVSNMARKGVSVADASKVIDALEAERDAKADEAFQARNAKA